MNLRYVVDRSAHPGRGFSMIDVLVSIVVMATALLALAVLQGTLARNTADSRARTLIAQLGDSLIDNAHQAGFSSLTNGSTTITPAAPTAPATCATPGSLTSANLAYCAQQAAGVGGLSVTQAVTTYTFASKNVPNPTGCTDTFVTNVGTCPTTASTPQYKNVALTATWTDSSGTSRTLVENSIVSPLSLDTSGTLVQRDYGAGAVTNPIVRTNSPAVAGVIPIAISATTNTAATNPKPELSGVSNATSYNVLTYKSLGNSQVQIQQRIETNVIACSCQYGKQLTSSSGTNGVFAQAWRPTYWDGLKYTSPSPAAASLAGENPSPPSSQSPLCTYCCRDHRDFANDLFNPKTNAYDLTDSIVFDWARFAASDPHDHYSVAGNASTGYTFTKIDTSNTAVPYLEAARMIRVDGLWRTATDLIAEQSGMIATDSSSNIGFPTPASSLPATSWIPSADAEKQYQAFVKDYFDQKVAQGGTPNANNLYRSYALDDPALLYISKSPTLYLDSRGLYLDHLEVAAAKQIQSAISHCTSSNTIDCVLPYIPFTSINLTEVSLWTGGLLPSLPPSASNVVTTVGGVLCDPSTDLNKCDPTKTVPKGGVVITGSGGGQWDSVLMSISPSNRGITTSRTPIDPGDNTLVANYPSDTTVHDPASVPAHTDIQHFKVTAVAGDAFTVNLVGDPLTSDGIYGNDPTVNWVSNDGTDTGPYCSPSYSATDTDPNPFGCQTDLKLSTIVSPIAPLNLQVQGYTFIQKKTETDPCNSAMTTQHPYCEYYKVSRIDLNGTALGPQPTVSISNPGKTTEISQFAVPGLLANGVVIVNFTSKGETGATAQTCDTSTTPAQPVTWNPPPC